MHKQDWLFPAAVAAGFAGLVVWSYSVSGPADVSLAEPLIDSLAQSARSKLFWWKTWLAVSEFIYIIGNAFAEEVVFRGPLILLKRLVLRLKIPPFIPLVVAAIALSAVYAVLHLRDTLFANLAAFGLGLLLSAVVCKYGKLMPAVLTHIAWNIAVIFNPHIY